VTVESLKGMANSRKWTAFILLEMTLGIFSFILPFKIAVLVLLLPPVIVLLMSNFLYAYLIGVFLLPVWSITLTGRPETPGHVDVRLSDAMFFIAGFGYVVQGITSRRLEIRGSRLDLSLLVFFSWMFLSIMWTPLFLMGAKELLRKLNGLFIFYVTINVIRNRRDLDAAATVWVIAGVLAAYLGFQEAVTEIWQRVGRFAHMVTTRWGGFRAGGLEVTPNILGFFLNTALMMTMAQFLWIKRHRYRILLLCSMVVMLFALISTLSRSSIMGFVIGTGFLLYLSRRGMQGLAWAAGVAVGLVILVLLVGGSGYRAVLYERYVGIVKLQEAAGFVRRISLWSEIASAIFGEHAVIGTGVGGFVALSESYGAWQLKSPHNLYIYVATEFGLVGFLFFLGMVVSFVKLAIQGLRSCIGERERLVLAGLLAGTLLYAFQGLSINFILRESEVWILMGLSVAAIRIHSDCKTQ
jgi:hypothetical protein